MQKEDLRNGGDVCLDGRSGTVVGAEELGRASWWYIYYSISHRPSRLKHGLMGMGSRVVCHLDHIAGRHVADHACTTTVVRDFSVQYPVYLLLV